MAAVNRRDQRHIVRKEDVTPKVPRNEIRAWLKSRKR
jgi:hypothetical protein